MDADMELLRRAWCCRECGGPHDFESKEPDGGYYKFPPVIGRQHDADILFVGVKPRRSQSNYELHNALMADFNQFVELANNRVEGKPYIGCPGQEGHYIFHQKVVEAIHGVGVPFEKYAAVTELWLCAAVNKYGLPKTADGTIRRNTECRASFLLDTIRRIQPKVVIALGRFVVENIFDRVPDQLLVESEDQLCILAGHSCGVIHAPHPGKGCSPSLFNSIVEKARMFLQYD